MQACEAIKANAVCVTALIFFYDTLPIKLALLSSLRAIAASAITTGPWVIAVIL